MSNLLTSISLSSSQLLYQNDPKTIADYVQQTDSTIQSAISAIQHLTIIDRLQKGGITPSFIQTDVTKLIHKSISSKAMKWDGTKISLHGARVVKATDSFLLGLVLNELLENSCRYRSSNVDVSIDTNGDKMRISIRDDGEGIERDEVSRVFEPYFRIKKHRHRNNRAGLGLTTVETIAFKLDGSVSLDSSPSWGTKVELII